MLAALERLAADGAVVCAVDCRLTPTAELLCVELDAQRLVNEPELSQDLRAAGGFLHRLWRAVLADEEHMSAGEQLASELAERLTEEPSSADVGDALHAIGQAAGDAGAFVFFDEAYELAGIDEAISGIAGRMATPGVCRRSSSPGRRRR